MSRRIITNKKPLIGVSMRFNHAQKHLYLPSDYSEAIEFAGGIPVHLSLLPQKDYIKNVLNHIDGILLPGGGDIDPLRFGEEPKPGLGAVSPVRDENDLILLNVAEERNIPVLGICYGMQLLNVFRGGSVVQDIEREIPDSLNHRQGEPRDRLSHWITIEEDGLLFNANGKNRVLVNSHHHQAVDRIGENLIVSARASDGIVEALEDARRERFNLGVQWHPEISFKSSELSKLIFDEFVKAAEKSRT